MLDDLFRNMIVLVVETYVKKPGDVAAATAGKALWAAMKKSGWYDVRILGLTDVIGDQDDVPRDAFEQTAAKKLRAGEASYEEVSVKDGKRYLRVATGIPVVSENCVMCHANFKGDKGTDLFACAGRALLARLSPLMEGPSLIGAAGSLANVLSPFETLSSLIVPSLPRPIHRHP
jgi:Protein of unknown function (DUF3365)